MKEGKKIQIYILELGTMVFLYKMTGFYYFPLRTIPMYQSFNGNGYCTMVINFKHVYTVVFF